MATMQRPRLETSLSDTTTTTSTTLDPSKTSIPTPFPEQQQARQASRSPSATRRQSLSRGVSGMMDKVKRVMSASKDRGTSVGSGGRSQERGRSQSIDTDANGIRSEESRGRIGASAYGTQHLSKTATNTTSSTMYPLTETNSRSTSRGRTLALSTGRGGAGNMLKSSSTGKPIQISNGEESAEVIRQARSTSREREGRSAELIVSGRGGAGNMAMRSASRGRDLSLNRVPTVKEESERVEMEKEREKEKKVLEKYEKEKQAKPRIIATGRGGAGNIRSPDRSGNNGIRME